MTLAQAAVILIIILAGVLAYLAAHRSKSKSDEHWQQAYADKLKRQHDDAARRLDQWRNRAANAKAALAVELKRKRGRIGQARKAYNEAVAQVLKLEGVGK